MRQTVVGVAVAAITACSTAAAFAECSAADRAALIDFDRAWGKATRSGDRTTLEQVLADDFAGLGPFSTNKADTIANAVRNAASAPQPAPQVVESHHQINCTASSATIVHRTSTTTRRGTDEEVAYSRSVHVIEKRNGRWVAVSTTANQLADPQILIYLELDWNEAEKTQDRAWFERNLAAEFAGTPSSGAGAVLNKAEYIKQAFDGSKMDSLSLSDVAVRVIGDTAVVTGINQVKGRDAKGQAIDRVVRFTDTAVKRGGRWVFLASQGTIVPGKPGA